jgi:hypothetical protein
MSVLGSRHQAANDRRPHFPQQRTFVDQAAPTASGAALTGLAITGVATFDCICTVNSFSNEMTPPNAREARYALERYPVLDGRPYDGSSTIGRQLRRTPRQG